MCIYVLCALVFAVASLDAHAADGERAKRVLIVSTGSSFGGGGAEITLAKFYESIYPDNIERVKQTLRHALETR